MITFNKAKKHLINANEESETQPDFNPDTRMKHTFLA